MLLGDPLKSRRCFARALAGTGDGKTNREGAMRTSRERILTSHVGSLPRPDALIEMNRARAAAEAVGEAHFLSQLRATVADVVRRQHELGIDIPNDGESGKSV